jgi:hypothetical protein
LIVGGAGIYVKSQEAEVRVTGLDSLTRLGA